MGDVINNGLKTDNSSVLSRVDGCDADTKRRGKIESLRPGSILIYNVFSISVFLSSCVDGFTICPCPYKSSCYFLAYSTIEA